MKINTKRKILSNELVLFSTNNINTTGIVTTSLNIANTFNKYHDEVIRDIEHINKEILNSGIVPSLNPFIFEASEYKNEDRTRDKMYVLNFNATHLLMGGYKRPRDFRLKMLYVVRFNAMIKALFDIKQARISSKQIRGTLIDSIRYSVPNMPYKNKYSYIYDMIYANIFGSTAKVLRMLFDCKTNDLLRDYLDNRNLKLLYKVEKHVAVLLEYNEPKMAVSLAIDNLVRLKHIVQ